MSKGVGKPLTVELIAAKTKTNVIRAIKNLNLWGNDLEVHQLVKIRIYVYCVKWDVYKLFP